VQTVASGESLRGSPVDLRNLFTYAENDVFLAAQNHYFVLVRNPTELKDVIFKFLRAKPNRCVRFLLCDPRHDASVEAWGTMSGTSSNDANSYRAHLATAITEITSWLRDAADEEMRLRARCVPLVPLSVNFVDPSDAEGLAVVTPNLFERLSVRRAWYVLSKRENPNVFSAYWSAYEDAFDRGIDVLALPKDPLNNALERT
jgi:hypothetical protein